MLIVLADDAIVKLPVCACTTRHSKDKITHIHAISDCGYTKPFLFISRGIELAGKTAADRENHIHYIRIAETVSSWTH